MNKIYEATSTEAVEKLLKSLDGTTLVNFHSPLCGPCVMLEPILEELSTKHATNLIRVNVLDDPQIAVDYNVAVTPTTIIFIDKEQKEIIKGYQPLEEWIKLINKK